MLRELDKSTLYKREILQQLKKPRRKMESASEKKHNNLEPAGVKECAALAGWPHLATKCLN